jgi:hypothetical protein
MGGMSGRVQGVFRIGAVMRAVDAHAQSSACEHRIGDHMPDGTIYAGISPDTGKPMYATPADAPLMTFTNAMEYATRLGTHGHADWRLPSRNELDVLFRNRLAIGGFQINSRPVCYWASAAYKRRAWGQRFTDGLQCSIGKILRLSVRCVRSEIMRAAPKPAGNRNAAVKDLTVLELRFRGLTLSQIASRLKVSRSLIVTRLKRLRDPEYVQKRDAAYYAANRQRIKVKRVLK